MIVMVPVRLAGRKTVRPVSSEYFSNIWSTGALKNLRKCSARSACPSAAASVVAAAGVADVAGIVPGAAAWPATVASGLMLGAAFVAAPGRVGTGIATTFVFRRRGRLVMPVIPLRCASGMPGRGGRTFVAAAGELVRLRRGLVVLAISFVAALGAGAGACASICAAKSERSR